MNIYKATADKLEASATELSQVLEPLKVEIASAFGRPLNEMAVRDKLRLARLLSKTCENSKHLDLENIELKHALKVCLHLLRRELKLG